MPTTRNENVTLSDFKIMVDKRNESITISKDFIDAIKPILVNVLKKMNPENLSGKALLWSIYLKNLQQYKIKNK